MTQSATPAFSGSIPEIYHRDLGPLLFEPYARDLTSRLGAAALPGAPRILELACGTGVLTRHLLEALPPAASLTASDISQPMLAAARKHLPDDPRLTLTQADACALPFPDATFDAILCQFGVMFFPDKAQAMREARRVLRTGGVCLFSVWDSLDHNPIPAAVQRTLARFFPGDAPSFLPRLPYGWFNPDQIQQALRAGGFTDIRLSTLALPSQAPDARAAARGFLQGTPNAADLADRNANIPAILAAAAKEIGEQFGHSPCRAPMRAIIAEAR